jgi:hypothetical protein
VLAVNLGKSSFPRPLLEILAVGAIFGFDLTNEEQSTIINDNLYKMTGGNEDTIFSKVIDEYTEWSGVGRLFFQ